VAVGVAGEEGRAAGTAPRLTRFLLVIRPKIASLPGRYLRHEGHEATLALGHPRGRCEPGPFLCARGRSAVFACGQVPVSMHARLGYASERQGSRPASPTDPDPAPLQVAASMPHGLTGARWPMLALTTL